MSLVTTPAGRLTVCGGCASTRVTSISMTLTDGSRVVFVSCRSCERRSWQQDGEELPVDAVLLKAQKRR